MKIYRLDHESYGEYYLVMAESRDKALQAILGNLPNGHHGYVPNKELRGASADDLPANWRWYEYGENEVYEAERC